MPSRKNVRVKLKLLVGFVATALAVVGCTGGPTEGRRAVTPEQSPAATTYDATGLPEGWKPIRKVTGDVRIQTDGEVVHDLEVVDGTIYVEAKNVTLERVHGVGARVNNYSDGHCGTGLVVEDSTFSRGALGTGNTGTPVIGLGGYTVRNVLVDGAPEGLRVGAKESCGGAVVENSYIRITPPDVCSDWHGDGIQGYDGGRLNVRNSVIEFISRGCTGTAAFFYPDEQGNTSVDVQDLLVIGGGYPFRLGTPGSVTRLGVADQSWGYAPVDVSSCSTLSKWSAHVVSIAPNGKRSIERSIPCTD